MEGRQEPLYEKGESLPLSTNELSVKKNQTVSRG
jgi:hypothetical protein